MKKYKLGLALSGGGARGFAHLGIIKALNEFNIYPDIVSGTSAGSIAGAFYCAGYSPDEILEIFKQKKLRNLTKLHIPKNGILSLDNLRILLKEYIKPQYFEDLKIPLIICITNLNEGKAEYKNKGPLHIMVQASSAIPIVFSPVKINNTYYVDGGLIDNFPVKPLVRICDKIIGINIYPDEKVDDFESLLQIATRTFHIAVNKTTKYYRKKCDLLFEPEKLTKYNILELKNQQEIFDYAYLYAKELLTKTDIKSFIKN